MPHDIHGRLIEKGDVVAAKVWPDNEKTSAVQVLVVYPKQESCNLHVAHFDPRLQATQINAKDSELLLKHDGSKPEPATVDKAV